MWKFIHQLASPPHFYRIAEILIPWLAVPGLLLIGYGAYAGLFLAPDGLPAGRCFSHYLRTRTFGLFVDAGLHDDGCQCRHRPDLAHQAVARVVAAAAAPLGAWFTFLALATGSIWGKPMWGTWWEWGDPRLTSELIMLFLYFGYMALRGAIDDTTKADRASAVLALVGAVNVPIIHFSVEWWSSLHQGPTLVKEGGPAMDAGMLYPLLAMILGFTFMFGALLLRRVRAEVLFRERRTRWVRELILSGGN